jgi:hypothetical protein
VTDAGKADSTTGASSGDQRPAGTIFVPCTLLPIPVPLFGLQYSFYLSSRPAHPICTLSIPRHLCSYNTYYTYNTHQARSHAPILSLSHRIILYHTVIRFSLFLNHLDLCSAVTFRSFPFPFFFSSFRFVYLRCSLPFTQSCFYLFLSSLLSHFVRRLICAHSLSFTLPLPCYLLPRDSQHLGSRQRHCSEAQE